MTYKAGCWLLFAVLLFAAGCGDRTDGPDRTGEGMLPVYGNSEAKKADEAGEWPDPVDYSQFRDYVIPPLAPDDALERFELEEGFRIEIVAHEPDVIDPVAMDIDPDGRLWVAEMISYMPRHDLDDAETSRRERVPQGRIVVLEDTSGDGRVDHRRIFMEDLILPRTLKVLDDGVLIGEPPVLWFLQDTTGDGVADRHEKVSREYGEPLTRNVEHMVNGLLWGMDNWIHSADIGAESYRRVDGEWIRRPFEYVGQWGLAQDDWGRLYSSHNTRTLQTHLAPYGYSQRHPERPVTEGINVNIAESETMWPAHPTGVNRGYRVGREVREDGTLKRSTSTCGPVIYRGDQFGEEYLGDAFVPEPAGNLIKRLTGLMDDPAAIEAEARFAYREKEFLTSTDERFRPVNLYNAPDGSIYVVDMYRGLFQHARFLTDHLRDYAVEHDLHRPVGPGRFGRIYRIVRESCEIDYETPELTKMEPAEWVGMLSHRNGLLRDQAQQLLVQRSPEGVAGRLEEMVRGNETRPETRLHALWTLEGLASAVYGAERLRSIALEALEDGHPRVRAAAVRILERDLSPDDSAVLMRLAELAGDEPAPYVLLQLTATLGEADAPEALDAIARILDREPENRYVQQMVLNGVYGRESDLLARLVEEYGWPAGGEDPRSELLEELLALSGADLDTGQVDANQVMSRGEEMYGVCAVCHGAAGEGVAGVGPALDGSDLVTGPVEPLLRVILHGYTDSEWGREEAAGSVMPAHSFMSDEEIAAVATWIRRSWDNRASEVTPEQVRQLRERYEGRQTEWTPETVNEP